MARLAYRILGFSMVGLGLLGIVLPVLPTTPFLLVAVWAFGKSSVRLREWVLNNRIFGGYVRAYRSGRGVPVRVKVWTLALLWASIGFSIARVDPIWLKWLLGGIAVAVTVHVLLLGRHKILVLVPTEEEAAGIENATVCGVGMAEMAATLTRALRRRRPRLVVLAGIAGAYPESGLKVGDCVVVGSERVAGLPDKYNSIYVNSLAEKTTLCRVAGVTVSRVGEGGGDGIENMEGAAFFAICQAAGVPFLELRAVSNMVGDPREKWCVDVAVQALGPALKQIIDEVES